MWCIVYIIHTNTHKLNNQNATPPQQLTLEAAAGFAALQKEMEHRMEVSHFGTNRVFIHLLVYFWMYIYAPQ